MGNGVKEETRDNGAAVVKSWVNGIEFEEVYMDLPKKQHKSPEFLGKIVEINPTGRVPAMVHGDFKLFESHAILTYLAPAFPQVADHCDIMQRAKVQSVLDWHHSNLRHGSATYIFNAKVAPIFGLPLNTQVAAEGEKILSSSLSTIVFLADRY